MYCIQQTMSGWVRDLVLQNVHNTRSRTQQNTVNFVQYLFKSSAWRWLHRNEPKHVAVKYYVKYLLIIIA